MFVVPILARAHVLLGYYLSDQLYRFAGIGSSLPGTFPGFATIDPNEGFVDQALTTHAMKLIFSGHFPWWNSLEGFGSPLAGEMQSSALFPFSPLVLLPNGNLIVNIVVGICAGIGMLLLLRRIGLQPVPALVGAVLFESCGTFSWLSGAWSYAVPWIPFLILGCELCRTDSARELRVGIVVIATSLALMLYSGFVEIAYFEGLLGVLWVVVRAFGISSAIRVRYAIGLFAGACLGLALAAPLLVAFADTIAMSFIGMHDANRAGAALPPATFLQKLVPYVYGPIFATHQAEVADIWGNTGGYVGFVVAALAICGTLGRRYRGLRLALAVAIVLSFAAILGGPLQRVLLAIPVVKFTAYYRYIDPAMLFSFCVLAAFAIEDVLVVQNAGRRILLGLIGAGAITLYAYGVAVADISGPAAGVDADLAVWHAFSYWEVVVASAAILLAALVRGGRIRATILGFIACAEAFVFLVIPTLSNPTGATIALAGLRYLHANTGLQRTYSLGPLNPNYGSYFDVATLDYNDLPNPARTIAYIKKHLDPLADPINFLVPMARPGMTQKDNFVQRVAAFEAVGVKYVLTPPNDPAPVPGSIRKVRDSAMTVYELPHPTPYFSAPGCRLAPASRTSVTTVCERPSIVCRLELNVPGWMADVGGRPVRPEDCGEIFEAVAVPKGTSHINFRFTPPRESIGLALGAIAFAVCFAIVLSLAPRRRVFDV